MQMTVIRTIVISGEQHWVLQTLEKSLVSPERAPFQAAYGTIYEQSRSIAETPGGNGAFEASKVGPTPTSVANICTACGARNGIQKEEAE